MDKEWSELNKTIQVFFAGNYQERIHSPIVTTGNELVGQQITDFSKRLDLDALYSYMFEVRESTENMLEQLSYDDLKRKIPEDAIWLMDYWCRKDIRGLIQMPLSRHWIMHTEACLRIKDRIRS